MIKAFLGYISGCITSVTFFKNEIKDLSNDFKNLNLNLTKNNELIDALTKEKNANSLSLIALEKKLDVMFRNLRIGQEVIQKTIQKPIIFNSGTFSGIGGLGITFLFGGIISTVIIVALLIQFNAISTVDANLKTYVNELQTFEKEQFDVLINDVLHNNHQQCMESIQQNSTRFLTNFSDLNNKIDTYKFQQELQQLQQSENTMSSFTPLKTIKR